MSRLLAILLSCLACWMQPVAALNLTQEEKAWLASEPEVRLPPSSRRMDADAERAAILDALERTVWNQSAAAKLLGMPRRTLVKRLAQYDLPRPRKRDS